MCRGLGRLERGIKEFLDEQARLHFVPGELPKQNCFYMSTELAKMFSARVDNTRRALDNLEKMKLVIRAASFKPHKRKISFGSALLPPATCDDIVANFRGYLDHSKFARLRE